ncbi:MAG: hypothetical protein QM754_13780 [Tepidisphaeraceae bacterium]
MSRVLLLHEPNLSFEPRRLVTLLAERLPDAQTVPLWPQQVVPTIFRLNRQTDRPALVHAFGKKALAVALMSGVDVLYSATGLPTRSDVAWLRAAMKYRSVKIACSSDAERRTWVTNGVPADRCRLVRPGVSIANSSDTRTAARQQFGYTESDRVIFMPLPFDPKPRSTALWTGNLLNIMDERTQTLAWSDGGRAGVQRLNALRDRLMMPQAAKVVTDDSPAAGFAAADVVLFAPRTDFTNAHRHGDGGGPADRRAGDRAGL